MAIPHFSAITVPIRNFFSSIANIKGGVRKEATLLDLNNLVDLLNTTVFSNVTSTNFTYRLTESLGVVTSSRLIGTGSGVAVGTDCPSCHSGTDFDVCGNAKGFYCVGGDITMGVIGLGVYNFNIIDLPPQINDIAVTFGNVPTTGAIINATRISNTQYTVIVFDTITGVPIANALTDVIVKVDVW